MEVSRLKIPTRFTCCVCVVGAMATTPIIFRLSRKFILVYILAITFICRCAVTVIELYPLIKGYASARSSELSCSSKNKNQLLYF